MNKVLEGRLLSKRPERLFKDIFKHLAVLPSADIGLLGFFNKLHISGDGTCILSGASSYGIKVCDCVSKGIYNCKCPRSYSDSDATWGWDSYHEQYFYGHTGYFFSVYNKNIKLDLPVYLRIVQAKRNDAVSAIVALSEVKDIYPSFNLSSFIGDAIHDDYLT